MNDIKWVTDSVYYVMIDGDKIGDKLDKKLSYSLEDASKFSFALVHVIEQLSAFTHNREGEVYIAGGDKFLATFNLSSTALECTKLADKLFGELGCACTCVIAGDLDSAITHFNTRKQEKKVVK